MMILLCLSAILAFTSAGRLSANYNSEPSRTYIPANVQVDPYPQQSVASAALIRPSAVFAQPSQTYLPANRNFVAPAKLVAPAIQTPVVSAGYTGIGYGGVHVRGVGEGRFYNIYYLTARSWNIFVNQYLHILKRNNEINTSHLHSQLKNLTIIIVTEALNLVNTLHHQTQSILVTQDTRQMQQTLRMEVTRGRQCSLQSTRFTIMKSFASN